MTVFRKIFRYLKPYTVMIVFSVALMIAEVASNVLQPKYMEQIVDDGVMQMNMDVITRAGIMMLVVAVAGGVGGFISCVLSNIYSQRFGSDLRKSLFRKILSLSPQQGDVITSGSLINRMTGDTRTVTEFSSVVIQMVVKPLMLFVFGIVMVLSIDPVYGLILLVSLPLQVVLMIFFIRHSSRIFRVIQQMVDKLNASAIHIVSNNRLIKAYVREDYETAGFDRQNIDLTGTVLRVQLFMSILNPIVMFILNAVVLAVIFVGGFQVEAAAIQVGSIMAAISYSQQIMMSMMTLGGFFQYISRTRVSAERLAEVMDMEPAIVSGEKTLGGAVESIALRNVTFRYPRSKDSKLPAIDGVTLEIKRGENIGVLGATGSGKSTLASLIVRSYDPDGGEVLINGENIKNYSLHDLRSRIVPVFQSCDIFPASLRDNITRGCADYTQEDFDRAVRSACVDEFADGLVNGIDTVIAERGNTLSGGQRQRVAIARALLRKAQVLILDDSTSSLDLETERAVMDNINQNYPEVTKIVISQRVSSVRSADKIVLIGNGRVTASGTHAQLMESSEQYRLIFGSQNPEGGDAHD